MHNYNDSHLFQIRSKLRLVKWIVIYINHFILTFLGYLKVMYIVSDKTNSVPDFLALKVCTHSFCLFLQPSQSWKRQRDLQSPCPDESIQSVDPALSHTSLLHPVVGQQEEKPTLKSVARLSTSWVRDTRTRTSRKHWWLHRTISKWPRISYASLSPFPLPRMFLHSTLLCPSLEFALLP